MDFEKTCMLTRESVHLINMNADIEKTVNQCSKCLEYQHTQPPEAVLNHNIPFRPWEAVGAYILMVNNHDLLFIVDYYSKFPVVKK